MSSFESKGDSIYKVFVSFMKSNSGVSMKEGLITVLSPINLKKTSVP